ncbi:MAG: hypothetical protein AAF318_17875 [Pseudomonadota bacterium]
MTVDPVTEDDLRAYEKVVREAFDRPLRLPNLIGVGCGRAGTSALYGLLRETPSVHTSSVKELNFFGVHEYPYHETGMSVTDYCRNFLNWNKERWCCEISPVYLTRPYSIESIQKYYRNTDVRFIVQLRHPIERAVSQLWHFGGPGVYETEDSFFEAGLDTFTDDCFCDTQWEEPAKVLAQSIASNGLAALIETFGRSAVIVLIYDELKFDPSIWANRLSAALDVNVPTHASPYYANAATPTKQGRIGPSTHRRLTEFFEPELKRLAALTDNAIVAQWAANA